MWVEVSTDSQDRLVGVTGDGKLILPLNDYSKRTAARTPLYHRGLEFLSGVKGLEGLILPFRLAGAGQFSAVVFMEHLRLHADSNIARLPVCLLADDSITEEELVRTDARYEKHLALGLHLSRPQSGAVALNESELNEIVGLILEGPSDNTSRHDMANRWGPALLMKGLQLLGHKPGDALRMLQQELLENLSYKVWDRSAGYIQESVTPKGCNELTEYRQRLEDRNVPLRVLVVDDMLDSGWRTTYQECISLGKSERVRFTWAKSTEEALQLVTDSANRTGARLLWDLVLLDLRLEPYETARAHLADANSIMDLSGMKVLQAIKVQDPTLPVILATASEKAYSYDAVLQEGADGYWIKDGPERSEPDQQGHIRSNTISLLKLINRNLDAAKGFRPIFHYGHEIRNLFNELFERQLKCKVLSEHFHGNRAYGKFVKNAEKASDDVSMKIDTLYAILHSSPSTYVEDKQKRKRWEMAFLISYSLMNEIKLQFMEFNSHGRTPSTSVGYLIPGREVVKHDISSKAKGDDVNGLETLFYHVQAGDNFYIHDLARDARNQLSVIHSSDAASPRKYSKEVLVKLCQDVLELYSNLLKSILRASS
jgi:CheY-like chemotaxis protein